MTKTCFVAVLAVTSALCTALGDVLQQRTVYRFASTSIGPVALLCMLFRKHQWRRGVLLLVIGTGLEACALSQGSVLLVQALLALSVFFALVTGARLSGHKLTTREWIWSGTLTATVAIVVYVGHPQSGQPSGSPYVWAAATLVITVLLLGCIVAARRLRGAAAAVLYALAAGSLWGVFAVVAKRVVDLLGDDVSAVSLAPEFLVLLTFVWVVGW